MSYFSATAKTWRELLPELVPDDVLAFDARSRWSARCDRSR